nr:hypothetical protein [Tanacetum cinerariifolium]
ILHHHHRHTTSPSSLSTPSNTTPPRPPSPSSPSPSSPSSRHHTTAATTNPSERHHHLHRCCHQAIFTTTSHHLWVRLVFLITTMGAFVGFDSSTKGAFGLDRNQQKGAVGFCHLKGVRWVLCSSKGCVWFFFALTATRAAFGFINTERGVCFRVDVAAWARSAWQKIKKSACG